MYKVYLSPSTQEGNVGYGNYGTEEFRMNQVADVVEKVLIDHGITVYRNKPTMALTEVVADSNNRNPDIHVAIHSNADSGKARGCEVFCHKLQGEGYRLAQLLYKDMSDITPTADRGIKQGYDYFGTGKHLYETAYTKVPAALIEIAFHDNPDDAVWIINNIDLIGNTIANSILTYFGILSKDELFDAALKIVIDRFPELRDLIIKIAKEME